MYGYDEMVEKDKKEFDDWYETVKNTQFDFRQEMYKYCKSDVDILRRGCQELRQKFMEVCISGSISVHYNCKCLHGNLQKPISTRKNNCSL